MDYYAIPAISHSAIKEYLRGDGFNPMKLTQVQDGMKLGNVMDTLLTEGSDAMLNKQAYDMAKSWERSDIAKALGCYRDFNDDGRLVYKYRNATGQNVFIRDYQGVKLKCKTDLLWPNKMVVDTKVTTCKTERDFYLHCQKLGYFDQGAYYMCLTELPMHIIAGISKHYPHPVFTLPILASSTQAQESLGKYFDAIDEIIAKYIDGQETV